MIIYTVISFLVKRESSCHKCILAYIQVLIHLSCTHLFVFLLNFILTCLVHHTMYVYLFIVLINLYLIDADCLEWTPGLYLIGQGHICQSKSCQILHCSSEYVCFSDFHFFTKTLPLFPVEPLDMLFLQAKITNI